MKMTRQIAKKVLATVDAGLVSGVGVAEPGKMCVEAAVCFALGETHGDRPSCVGAAVRAFKIRLNDAHWSSNATRTAGMRAIAIAQLGSDKISQRKFATRVTLAVIREILPLVLHQQNLHKEADACTAATTLKEGYDAAAAAYAAAANAADAAAHATNADAAAYAAADAAAAAYAVADAAANAADAAAHAAAHAAYAAARADTILCQAAEIGVRILTELKSPGVQWLDLVNER